MYKFRNGDPVEFTQDCVCYQLKNGKRNKIKLEKGQEGSVLHVDRKMIYIKSVDGAPVSAVVEVLEWDPVEHYEPHESQVFTAISTGASYLASRVDLELLTAALIHGDMDQKEKTEEWLRFLRASSACYRQADMVSEGFHSSERAFLAELSEKEGRIR